MTVTLRTYWHCTTNPCLNAHIPRCSFYSSAAAGREGLASTIPVRRLREAIAREDKFIGRLAESAAADLGASGAGGAGGYGSPASPLRTSGGAGETALEFSTPSPGGLSRSTRVQGKFEVDGRDVRAGIARHMYDHVHGGAASTPPDWQRTKKDTFYHLKSRSSDERPVSTESQRNTGCSVAPAVQQAKPGAPACTDLTSEPGTCFLPSSTS